MIVYKIVAGPTVTVKDARKNGRDPYTEIHADMDCKVLNNSLKDGWILEHVVTHTSHETDHTAVAFLLKKGVK